MTKMFEGTTPYDMILSMQQRIINLETQHNRMAMAVHKSEQEFNEALKMLADLQRRHMNLMNNTMKLSAKYGVPLDPYIDQKP
jgi:riboflavin synthase